MQMNDEGLALIREAEGFRDKPYRDAAGVWTVGFGHTSMAGPPDVVAGLEVTGEEAAQILARDVSVFASGVAKELVRPLTDGQFSALVSFAYNVGLANFRGSGVLKAVNAGDFEAVPRRLQLWVKAGGRVLPGLVKRRAAEAALFMQQASAATGPVEIIKGKPAQKSTTIWAAAMVAILAVTNHVAQIVGYSVFGLALTAGIIAAAIWIIRERHRKSLQEGI